MLVITRLIALAVVSLVGLSGCVLGPGVEGSGKSITEPRTVEAFTKVRLEGSPDVTITVGGAGAKRELTVSTDDNILPLIETEVNGDTLVIGSTESFKTRLGVKVNITVESIDFVSVAGSGNINVTGANAAKFGAEVTGSGNVTVVGDGESIDCKVTGSGDIDATKFNAVKASALVTGSGDIKVRASDSLNASVTGSGDIHYVGSPKDVQRQVTGSGRVSGK